VRALLDVAVAVENDVNLMALAALHEGVADAAEGFAFVWIDDGLGAAMVRDGALIRGTTGGAGEIDYLRIPTAHGSAGEKLGDLLSPAALEPIESALSAEEDASAPVEEVVRALALGLASVVAVLDPALIVLGGRYGAAIAAGHSAALRHRLAAVLETEPASVPEVRGFAVDATTAISGAERVALDTARRIAFRSGSLTPTSTPGHAAVQSGDHL
jgi:predicted NBD/HSP70 family sugar kinase